MVATLSEETARQPLPDEGQAGELPGESGWSRGWLLAGLALLLGFTGLIGLHWSTATETVRIWNVSETFNHCFLIFPISAYLVWRRADRLKALEPSPWLPGLVPLLGASLFWLAGNLAGVLVVEQIALVAMAQSMVLTLLGWRVVRVILFPLFFWVFAIPIGNELIPFFQHVTAQFIVPLLRASGIPVYLEGLYLYIPSGSFEVAEACSGVRYLISSITLGFLASHVLFDSHWKKAVFVLLSFIVPILANGLRAYGIVMIAHLSDYRYAIGVDHLVYGWLFFSFVTFCLLGIGLLMRGKEEGMEGAAPAPLVAIPRLTAAPRRIGLTFLLAGAAAASGFLYKGYLESGIAEASAAAPPTLQAESPWTSAAGHAAGWQPIFPGATQEHRQGFHGPLGRVDFYTAFYAYQRQGAEVVNAVNRPVGADEIWRGMSSGRQVVQLAGGDLEVRQVVARSTEGERMVWYWFWVDRQFTASRYMAKLLELKGKLLNQRGEAAVVAVSTEIDSSPADAVERLRAFLGQVEPIDGALTAYLAEADG